MKLLFCIKILKSLIRIRPKITNPVGKIKGKFVEHFLFFSNFALQCSRGYAASLRFIEFNNDI